MKKLSDWIDKARYNKTKDKELIHELKKIVVLEKSEEPIETGVNDVRGDIVQQKRARFVLPEDTKKSLEFQHSIIESASDENLNLDSPVGTPELSAIKIET